MSGQAAIEPKVYHAGLVIMPSGVDAVVFDLPGCTGAAADEAAAREMLPIVIAEHLAWLDRHGDVTRNAFPFEVEFTERVDVEALDGISGGEFLFKAFARPVSHDDLETAVRRLGYAREDLLAVVSQLPDPVLDWCPPASAFAPDEPGSEVRSIRRVLGHIAGSDAYYAGNIGDAPWERVRPGDIPDLFDMRREAIERLDSLTPAELAGRWDRRHPWDPERVEQWTVRKALHRFIVHERFHVREIEQRLAWLLVGPPVLERSTVTPR
ncbi:MAG TPA: DinB family protein [Dehalococcoidia bacterium]